MKSWSIGQQVGSIVQDYLFLYTDFEGHNTVFTNELFQGVVSLSTSRGTIASSTIRGDKMRLLMKTLAELPLEPTNEYRTNRNPNTTGLPLHLILDYESGEKLYICCSDLCCYLQTLNSDGIYESVEPGVYYALTGESIEPDNLIRSYFHD